MKLKLLTLTVAAAVLPLAGTAQDLYTGTKALDLQGITLTGWGSGTISETDEIAFDGTTSIRISSRNFYQGGIIKYSTPVDLAMQTENAANLLHFTFHVPGAAVESNQEFWLGRQVERRRRSW